MKELPVDLIMLTFACEDWAGGGDSMLYVFENIASATAGILHAADVQREFREQYTHRTMHLTALSYVYEQL